MGESPREKLFGSHPDDNDHHGFTSDDDQHPEQPTPKRGSNRREAALAKAEQRRAAGETNVDYNPNRRRGLLTIFLALVLVLGASTFAWRTLGLSLPNFGGSSGGDYAGSGDSDTVKFTIQQGDAGSVIGSNLVGAGVTKSTSAFLSALAANPNAHLQPGVYKLHKHQSAASALAALLDPKNRIGGGVIIQEGLWASEIFSKLSKATGHPISEYQAVTAQQLGLPDTMDGKVEGWLFPSTYNFTKKMSARQQLQTMVDNTKQQLATTGVNADQFQTILTKASIIQGESPNAQADGKVARVIENRLSSDMPLQMDSSVHYILHKRGTVTTSDQERTSDSPYNSYVHKGLPPTPYDNPGLDAIKAAANPPAGPWKYFVTVNLATGETLFASTYEEQQANEAKFHAWCKANPGKGC